MKIIFVLFWVLISLSSRSESLVKSYAMESDRYLFEISYRCLSEHVKRNSNAIDPKTSLPVGLIASLNVSQPFTLNVVIVGFQYIGRTPHIGAGLKCYYDRQSGELLSISSYNSDLPSQDIIPDVTDLLKSSYEDRNDDVDKLFGIELDYDEFIWRVERKKE